MRPDVAAKEDRKSTVASDSTRAARPPGKQTRTDQAPADSTDASTSSHQQGAGGEAPEPQRAGDWSMTRALLSALGLDLDESKAQAGDGGSGDKALVLQQFHGGEKDEIALTNAVFYKRHPKQKDQSLTKGSPMAAEWLAIRDELVRPAIASSHPPPAPAANAAAEQKDGPSFWLQAREILSEATKVAMQAGESTDSQSSSAADADGSTYHSQRDNKFHGQIGKGEVESGGDVYADNECNVTSLAMQLHAIAGSEQRLRQAACDLLEKKHNQKLKKDDREEAQIEDLLLRRFFIDEWASGKKWGETFGAAWLKNCKSKKFHQDSACLAYVAKELSESIKEMGPTSAGTACIWEKKIVDGEEKTVPKWEMNYLIKYFTSIKPTIDAGGSAIMGTYTTKGGHIVTLVAVDADGIVINDPYGLVLGKNAYLRNGDPRTAAKATFDNFPDAKNVLARRAKVNPVHLTALEVTSTNLPGNMGERVYFNWEEVMAMEIGLWTSVISKVAEPKPRPHPDC